MMDVKEKLIEICFREFCDLAGDSPCGCDGCPYGEYEPDNGGCYVEYKKDKIEKLENDMDKYQKEDNGVTVQEWISVEDRLPENGDTVLCFMKFGGQRLLQWDEASSWWLGYGSGDDWQKVDVTHWQYLPAPPKGE